MEGTSIHQDVTSYQIELVAEALRDLMREHEKRPVKGDQWLDGSPRFTRVCYACGFVCTDLSPFETQPLYEAVMKGRPSLSKATLLGLRMFFHYMIRNDRHCGGGVVEDFVASPYAKVAHERLMHFAEG